MADLFSEAGYAVDRRDNSVIIQPINLTIEAKVLETEFGKENCSVVLGISCSNSDKIPEGISEMSTAWARTYEQAIEEACRNWMRSDFVPIHDYLCSTSTLLGGYGEVACFTEELNETIGWDLFFGPRLEATQNKNVLEVWENEKARKQIQEILFQPMTDSLFGTPGLYYIRIFMYKINNTEIECDCRVNGSEWKHGKDYLIRYITEYQSGPGIFWIKQNLLIAGKSADRIKSGNL